MIVQPGAIAGPGPGETEPVMPSDPPERDDGDADTESDAAGNIGSSGAGGGVQRLDKWLWFARVAKSRTLAATLVAAGKVRVNRVRIVKASHGLKPGDVVTINVGPRVRVLKVLHPGIRRGPATEARGLFDELTPPREGSLLAASDARAGDAAAVPAARPPGAGRPTKRERRQIEGLKGKR